MNVDQLREEVERLRVDNYRLRVERQLLEKLIENEHKQLRAVADAAYRLVRDADLREEISLEPGLDRLRRRLAALDQGDERDG